MTEEQIRPIAENYVEEFCLDPDDEYTSVSLVCAGIGTAMIVARILEKQIKKMRCCENCKHHVFYGNELCCKLRYDWESECLKTREKWELAE